MSSLAERETAGPADGARMDKGERNEMRLIARAAAILRALPDRPRGASLGEIAKATGLPRASVQRIVGALEAEGLVSTGPNLPGVRLGGEIARLASYVQRDARDFFRPYMEALLHRAQETVDLTMLKGGAVTVIEQLASTQSLRVVSHVGRPLPLHATASGKAHLSRLDAAGIRALLPKNLERFTPKTKTAGEDVVGEIEASALRGFFLDEEEFATDVCAIGFAVADLTAGNFAIAISMPIQRFTENFERYVGIVVDVNRRIALRSEGTRLAD
jgi:IclR family transcriptional regulator, acetate operon repressor